ncbi:MAG: ammonium transporter [Pedosphaera sp.]|nr:ammonium transporter [Pedosphaera sp.]
MQKSLLQVVLLIALSVGAFSTPAADATAKKSTPTTEQRLDDLEAYINNTARAHTDKVESKIPGAGPGHNGWMMTSTALVLFMTLPGLALFYGGLVRRKNVLSVIAQCIGLAGLVTILWVTVGYSFTFGKGCPFYGGTEYFLLNGVNGEPNTTYANWVSHNVWAMYQMMFAIITPALIVGAIAERMKFSAVLLFVTLWMFVVYFPAAHMIWGQGGWMNGLANDKAAVKAIDFAGGIVVHITSGWSALALCILLKPRLGHGKQPMPPHNLVLCSIGTGMLWVGWYGFNAGSAVAADTIAANAFVTTTLSAAVGSFVWGMIEYITKGKPSVLGFCSGAIGGLATITPACGFVEPKHALLIGAFAGTATYLACTSLKRRFGYDDTLDTFGVHAIGGTLGTILAGVFATSSVNANLDANLKSLLNNGLWIEQLKACAIWIVWSVLATVVIAKLVDKLVGLRVSEEVETLGLDLTEHGEEGYNE